VTTPDEARAVVFAVEVLPSLSPFSFVPAQGLVKRGELFYLLTDSVVPRLEQLREDEFAGYAEDMVELGESLPVAEGDVIVTGSSTVPRVLELMFSQVRPQLINSHANLIGGQDHARGGRQTPTLVFSCPSTMFRWLARDVGNSLLRYFDSTFREGNRRDARWDTRIDAAILACAWLHPGDRALRWVYSQINGERQESNAEPKRAAEVPQVLESYVRRSAIESIDVFMSAFGAYRAFMEDAKRVGIGSQTFHYPSGSNYFPRESPSRAYWEYGAGVS